MSKQKTNIAQVRMAKRILTQINREYSTDLSERYERSLSDILALLKDIEEDLQERS